MWPVVGATAVVIFLVAATQVQVLPKTNSPTVVPAPAVATPAGASPVHRPLVDEGKKAVRGRPCSCLPRLY